MMVSFVGTAPLAAFTGWTEPQPGSRHASRILRLREPVARLDISVAADDAERHSRGRGLAERRRCACPQIAGSVGLRSARRGDSGPTSADRLRLGTVYAWDPVERRIFGLENEYGITATWRGQRRLSPDEVARYLFRKVVSWGRSSNVFLANGARLYLDVGSHPEYATPECDDIVDLVTHDKAGERVLEGLLVDAERRLRDEGISGDVYLFKNNTDSARKSYGCHENYLVSRHGEFSRLADVLIPFLVTRQVIVGA